MWGQLRIPQNILAWPYKCLDANCALVDCLIAAIAASEGCEHVVTLDCKTNYGQE